MAEPTSKNILAIALEMLDTYENPADISMRKIAGALGMTPMALYKHFANREALLAAAISQEYERLAEYFKRANKSSPPPAGGMLGYLHYAFDHPNLFRYFFATKRPDAFVYPDDLNAGRSPTLNTLQNVVSRGMAAGRFQPDDVYEVSLTIWAHAHGLVMLYLSSRIRLPKEEFQEVYTRSMNRIFKGLSVHR